MPALTPRQEEFLTQFVAFYQRTSRPVHYPELAEELNLGKVTVYEKLRLLEEAGFARAEYHLPEGDRGPGRSTVHYLPTRRALETGLQDPDSRQEIEHWKKSSAELLHRLENAGRSGYDTVLRDLVNRIPQPKSPLVYLTEVSTAIVLALNSLRGRAENIQPLQKLGRLGLPGEIDLGALPGIGLSLELVGRLNRTVSSFLADQSGKFQTTLQNLDDEKQRLVSDFTRRVAELVSREKPDPGQ
jgi:hypothetical protein